MKKLIGLFASVALMGSGMALAQDQAMQDPQTQSQSGKGGSGSQMGHTGMSEQMGGNQLTGRVVKSERKMIWVEHMGAVVPLKIDKNTQFTDPTLKRATDLKEGDQIRASFEVKKTENIATSIGKGGLGEGQGGSGSDVMKPDQGINQPMESLPPSPGTGGSGRNEQSGDIHEGASPDSGLKPGDVNSDQSKSTGDY